MCGETEQLIEEVSERTSLACIYWFISVRGRTKCVKFDKTHGHVIFVEALYLWCRSGGS